MIKTPQNMKDYTDQIRQTLKEKFLQTTLNNFAVSYKASRAKAFSGMDLEGLREEIACAKNAALPRLEELLEEFTRHAEADGVKVHFAKTAQDANAIIAAIAKENNVKTIVKSKSMTAEETFLNDHLEKQGLTVTETDLGEWIIQLRHEGPSHMVMPAIHLSRYQVGDLFTGVSGEKQDPENIDKLVKVARKQLRPRFIEADMGISGANFAMADSGAIGIVTNEGNARLTTTLPRVHVTLAGVDKLIPDLKTALTALKALTRNATGQGLTSYVTWIKGQPPCGASDKEVKTRHIVFLDNGRLALAKDPVFSEVLRCIRCGACANVCPIYRILGGHTYGHVYIGAIGLILTFFYHGRDNARAIVKNCLNCQSCKVVCPAKIDLPYLIKKVYREVMDEDGKRPLRNRLLARIMGNRKLFHTLLKNAWMAQAPMADGPKIRHLPTIFGRKHDFRTIPVLAKHPLRDQWASFKPVVKNPKMKVALFAGCAQDFIYPQQAKDAVTLLASYGVEVDFPMEQTCCGLPLLMMAENETAKDVAEQNLKALDTDKYDYILTLCASCGSHIKENYTKLLQKENEVPEKVRKLEEKIIDFSSFMVKVLKVTAEDFRVSGKKVAYHAPCHLCRGLDVVEEPRDLMRIAGLDYIPAADEDVCCGFSGSYSVDFPEVSEQLLRRKVANLEATGADIVVTDCPGCVMQISGGMDKHASRMRVCHMAEILREMRKKE